MRTAILPVSTLWDAFRHEIQTERFRPIASLWIRPQRVTQRFPKLDDPESQKLRYLQGFPRSAYWLDGKIPKQNTEKNFTVRFTFKIIRRERPMEAPLPPIR
jgi:hypothetical protein